MMGKNISAIFSHSVSRSACWERYRALGSNPNARFAPAFGFFRDD